MPELAGTPRSLTTRLMVPFPPSETATKLRNRTFGLFGGRAS
ncbi:hypothetical protein [Amycolatopsis coloradensis]|nr:hypothetical protein [Amycolatopsis coloradensis]